MTTIGMLPPVPTDRTDVTAWVAQHLGDLVRGPVHAAPTVGGWTQAQRALDAFDVTGYAARRNHVWPIAERGASGLSPYVRHGLLSLPEVWQAVAGGPKADVTRFRDELLWQEYARHLYARVPLQQPARFNLTEAEPVRRNPWIGSAQCLNESWRELAEHGWITNQQRMWLASHWQVREHLDWRAGEDLFFQHLLDGSRAANRTGWQWVSGALTGKPYGFSRWQVRERAPGLCQTCALNEGCPIEDWPAADEPSPRISVNPILRRDPDPATTGGPREAVVNGEPTAVWLTAESLGDDDPALRSWPELPVLFVFDEPLLSALRLSAQRLVFLAECLADLGQRRDVRIMRGRPTEILTTESLAVTFAPVPGFRRRMSALAIAALHPWPWLVPPHGGPATSFTAWSRARR